MKVAVYSTRKYDEDFLNRGSSDSGIEFTFLETPLNPHTTALAEQHHAVNCFVNDDLSESVLKILSDFGIKRVSLRSAGFNNVNLQAAKSLGIVVSRAPAYSPKAVVEHTIALLMSLNRKIHKAYNRVKENKFALKGLVGFNIHGKTIGVVGTGKIGIATVKILRGFGANVLCFDPYPADEAIALGGKYVD